MASLNKVMLMGNLGQDPEIRQANGASIANLSLATSRKYKGQDGNVVEEVEWHRVVLFGRSAELAEQYLKKGSGVFIEGRLRTRKWADKDGNDRWTTEIVAENMQFVGGRNDRQDGGDAGYAPSPDGFESAPRPAPARQQAPAPQPSPAAASSPIDQLEEDVPF